MCKNRYDALCVKPETVTVTAVAVSATTATLTINRPLTSLSFLSLKMSCAQIVDLAELDVEFTDGTDTYPAFNWLGNTLQTSTLKKFFCGSGDSCKCDKCLVCFDGHDTDHVSVLTRVV